MASEFRIIFFVYLLVTSVRRSRPSTTTTASLEILSDKDSTIVIQEKSAALLKDHRRESKLNQTFKIKFTNLFFTLDNIGLVLLVVLLSSVLFTILCALLLYKR